MKMKTVFASLLSVLLTNVVSADDLAVGGNIGTKFASEYHRRGQIVSQDAIQAQVGFNVGLGGVDVFGDFFTNRSTASSGADNDELTVGFGTSLFEGNLAAYAGIYNTDNTDRETLEAFAQVGLTTLLSPTVSLYRDTDDSLYTFEGSLSHEFDLNIVELEIAGVLGNTELTSATDSTYYGAKVTATKTIKDNVDLYADVALTDTETRDNETLWGVGLSVKF